MVDIQKYPLTITWRNCNWLQPTAYDLKNSPNMRINAWPQVFFARQVQGKTVIARVLNKFRTWSAEQRAMAVPFPSQSDLASRSNVAGSASGHIVAFFTTDSIYESEARRMIASASRLGLTVSTTSMQSAGSWVKNASMKAEFLLEERKAKRGPLLYVDVDAVFHRDPWPALVDYDCDISVYYHADGRLAGGTILINDTP
ncbi:MAG TPA: hypothetical protein VK602_12345, partial [Phyllobacterium sp.]|nr:hypothetical protein [Phyllobacterium sp.]